ncbi:DNA methyltransferase [Croceivirga thetidis]|uniref:Site-specific DNA-methyltransferase n=1 Tax=Croceivirga thetidis TaxID=2721623 RepID=A0ABX1GKZ2_9FLAO|nr:DNA methyltransferase [Croceivirga thetidis]NKI30575.1 site-specific DNA-methyltransferase [Croceivirga thetidis]
MSLNQPLEQLKSFLNQLFQFDSQDLDFGVYKILHYKKKEIANFIDQLLVDKVKAELQTLSADEAKQVQEQILEFEKDDIIKGWLEADDSEKKTLEKFGKDKINQYRELKAKAIESSVSVETENQIYNHLTLFFSRYYDKGDFISKRRFGKNEKYVVPYNGEETHFHWANQDQYYIKSSETFNHYAFKVQTADSNLVVNFKLHNAQLEQGNVKAEETNFFMLSDKSPEIKEIDEKDLQFVLANKQPDVNEKEITIYFEYRPLGDEEKKKVKGNKKQDTLDELAFDFLKKEFGTYPTFANLWKEQEGKPLLLKKLQHYTRKNKHDFFIHKNLKGFLERELDYYIKSELVNIDDLFVTDTDSHFDRLKHNLKTIKIFKSIADTIIEFVSQIEDFQKKLWEKKKFVLSTEWVITIDRLVEYLGEEAAKPILEEVIKNEKQVAEWTDLFGDKRAPKAIEDLKADLHTWKKLPIDTSYFPTGFKIDLVNLLSKSINLSDSLDGHIYDSDNYHGLHLLKEAYTGKINNVYIDPPYNTSASEIIYKNSFKHSSWASLIENRIEVGKPLLSVNGNLCVTIDDVEMPSLSMIMSKIHGPKNIAGVIAIRANPSGRPNEAGLAIAHEYAIFAKSSSDSKIKKLPRTDAQLERYKEKDDTSIFEWRNFRREGSNSDRTDGKRQWYPVYANLAEGTIRIPKMEWQDESELWSIKEKPTKSETEIWPITDDGVEKNWRWSEENVRKDYSQFLTKRNKKDFPQVYYKFRPNTDGITPLTFWQDAKYSATEHGTKTLKSLFNQAKFSYPKSIWAVKDCLYIMGNERNSINLDYFPGSGTTFHAVQLLNKDDDGERKCLLIEQGQYFHTILVPRIKKVAYSFDWKDGKPKDGSMNGLGVFFKYQRLEQYEEALENIAFNASEDAIQKALEFEQYIPKYFLEFETKGSQTLVNTAVMQDPWDYKLKVWDGFTYDTEQAVDLVETFNYLIGLHMQKCITKELNGKKYQFIYGHNNANKNILVVWRSVKDWNVNDFKADAATLKTELKTFEYDLLYINDQAHIEGYQPIEEVFKNKMLP